MSDVSTGGGGSIGKDVSTGGGGFAGRDSVAPSQNVRIDFRDIEPQDIKRLFDIVLGDGYRWRGVAGELEKVEVSLTRKMEAMENRIEARIERLEVQMAYRPTSNYSNGSIAVAIIMVVLLALILFFIIWLWANGGA